MFYQHHDLFDRKQAQIGWEKTYQVLIAGQSIKFYYKLGPILSISSVLPVFAFWSISGVTQLKMKHNLAYKEAKT